jgi:LemA protein
MSMTAYIVLALLVLVLLWAVATYNGLISRRNMVAEGWSGIEAQLKRRADLIPNLVETVKGYATHERTTLDELTRLRGQATAGPQDLAHRGATEQAITAAIGRVMAVAEAYPQLRASENFQSLQKDLSEIENEIQMSRRYYNGTVRDYNTATEQAPANIIANAFAFKRAEFFQIENAADRAVPKVSFG